MCFVRQTPILLLVQFSSRYSDLNGEKSIKINILFDIPKYALQIPTDLISAEKDL